MLKEIATLVPTYKRAYKLEELIKNHNATSTHSSLYFVITPEDKESQECLERLGQSYFVIDLEYTQSINYAVKRTSEPFILCASDDIIFMPGWDEKLLELTKDETKHIFGGIDAWKISKTMLHISHPLVRRTYVDNHLDGNLYWTEYIHYMNDIELVQRGLKEGCVMITPEVLFEHPHPYNEGKKEDEYDATYIHSLVNREKDIAIYARRCGEFAMYDHTFFQQPGFAIPTKLNPLYNKTLVSVVIPSWNDADFLKKCLISLAQNTYYRYEIIIINNGSDPMQKTTTPWDLIDTKQFLDSIVIEDKSCEIRVIHWEKNRWINPAWNYGAKIAKGNYVVLANSDITFSWHWDKFLVAALEMPERKFAISCPFERRPGRKKAFGLGHFFKKYAPNMIKGPCFMFRKADVPRLFPIPDEIKHWCGDNVLADRAEKFGGAVFTSLAEIFHYVTQSGKRMKKSLYTERIYQDVLAYEKWSGKNMEFVKDGIYPKEYYSQFGEDKWISENIKLPKEGFYVDVGAGDSEIASNTKFLEDKRWKGVCIDADPSHIAKLKGHREAKIIEAVISDKEEEVTLNIAEEPSLTSINTLSGVKIKQQKKVKTQRLDSLVKKHINLLSIDVEGAELKVCDGLNWGDPPDIIIIEHQTMSEVSNMRAIKNYFAKLPYRLVYENEVNMIFLTQSSSTYAPPTQSSQTG